MSVRNATEIGSAILRIANRLGESQKLLRLLKYTDNNPFSIEHEDLKLSELLHKNIKVVPLVNSEEDNTESTVVIVPAGATVQNNTEFKTISFSIMVYVPFDEWRLNDVNLRPFLIISEIEKKLKGIRVESLGTINYYGFGLHLVTDVMSCYKMEFTIDTFN